MNDEQWQKLEVPCDPDFVIGTALFYFKTGKLQNREGHPWWSAGAGW